MSRTAPHPDRGLHIAVAVFAVAAAAAVALFCALVASGGTLFDALGAASGGGTSATGSSEAASGDEAAADSEQADAEDAEDAAEAEETTFTVSVAGDCTLGTDEYFSASTNFTAKYDEVGDASYFFANVYDLFSADDLTIVNLEGTLTDSTTRADKTFAFKGPAEYVDILTAGSVEACDLANNHSHDYGDESYTDTIENVEAAGISTFGYDRIAYVDVQGVSVALVGVYELAEGLGVQDDMEALVAEAQEAGAQVTIVYFHWGTELETVPDTTQVTLAHAAVDAGADLVVGSHPHVIQGYEYYEGVPIVYSLGNFCFGGNSNPSDYDCMIVQLQFTVDAEGAVSAGELEVVPCSVSSSTSINTYQPTLAEGDEAERILAKIEESNEAIAELSAQVG